MAKSMSNCLKTTDRCVPRNFGPLRNANANARLKGPCGDTMEFWLQIEGDEICNATFTTDGCEHSMQCGSIAASIAKNLSLEEIKNLSHETILSFTRNIPEESQHCALLATNTLKAALVNYTPQKNGCQNEGKSCSNCSEHSCAQASKEEISSSVPTNKIKNTIVVLSGKGGVGKSTVSVNLAMALSLSGKKVGLLDVDIHGPSIPTMLNLTNASIKATQSHMFPVEHEGLKVMSVGFLLNHRDDPIICRGPMKANIIQQFLENVIWGELDYLIVDCPPGTGDEPLSVCQKLSNLKGAIIVTTPQEVSAADVRKSVNFCRKIGTPILGVVENMSGFVCSSCGHCTEIFGNGSGKRIAEDFNIPFLGAIPIERNVSESGDQGTPLVKISPNTKMAQIFLSLIQTL